MRLLKRLVLLTFLLMIGGAIAAAIVLIKKGKSMDVSAEQWPEVPRNPAAEPVSSTP